jgi:hypothetical protein
MARRPRTSLGGLAYHVMNRVAGGQDLFEDGDDCAAFERVLAEAGLTGMNPGYVGQPRHSAWKARFDPSDGRRRNRSRDNGFCLGGPGWLPTLGSHRPVRARISAYGSSSHGFVPWQRAPCHVPVCYPLRSRSHGFEVQGLRHVSSQRFHDLTPPFPPQGPPGSSIPASQVL